jgi:hypothetical protein
VSEPRLTRKLAAVVAVLATAGLTALGMTSATGAAAATTHRARPAPVIGSAVNGGAVIVELKNQHANLNLRTQSTARRQAAFGDQKPLLVSVKAHGGTNITQLVSINAVAATVSAAEVQRLAANSAVKQIIPDETVAVQTGAQPQTAPPADLNSALCPKNPNKPLIEPEALSDMHAYDPGQPDEANDIATGKGVIVAIDGMDELAGNPNFIRPDGSHVVIDAPDPNADASNDEAYGDASSVAAQGTVVYDYSKELPFSGLPAGCTFVLRGDAPDATLVDTNHIDTPDDVNAFLTETEAQVVQGIDDAVTLEHANVLSESFGFTPSPGNYTIHYAANDAAVAAGVTVVVSSGDSGQSGTASSPASDPLVIEAGATNTLRENAQAYGYTKWTNDNITPLSSGGATPNNKVPDMVAPGYGGEAACNPAAVAGGCPSNTLTEAFGGTSQSAPLIAGAAADVIQAYRDTHGGASPTPAMVKDILTSTATDVDSPADQQGTGTANVYAAVRAAQQMPGSTITGTGSDSPGLIADTSQLDVMGDGGTTSDQDVALYNASDQPQTVTGTFRELGRYSQIGDTITEPVSAPDPSLPVPAEGALAATTMTFKVPAGLNRLETQMIWPDPTNGAILSYDVIDPKGALTQISYDFGTPSSNPTGIGSVPDIGDTQIADPIKGNWTIIVRWANGRSHLQEPPNVPGTYTGTLSFRMMGATFDTSKATKAVTIPANASVDVSVPVKFPGQPGDHPESVQFTSNAGETLSLPIARRTLIPSAGGAFKPLITTTVGRSVGEITTFDVNVPAGQTDLTVTFKAPDASPDNGLTYYLLNPSGVVVAEDATPTTTLQGNDANKPRALAALVVPNPGAGLWEIDVRLNLTESGLEFSQTIKANLAYNQDRFTVISGVPTSPATMISPSSPQSLLMSVTNTTGVGRSFSLTSSNGEVSSTPVYISAGATALVTGTITPTAAPGTVVAGTINLTSNDSAPPPRRGPSFVTQTLAQIPYTYTVATPPA